MGNATNLRVTRDNLVALPVFAPYFILGLLSFLAAPVLLLAAAPALEGGLHRHPYMLAAVHLYALGWGTAVALGALQQMTPVVFATVLHRPRWSQAALVLYAGGLVGLLIGFFGLSRIDVARPALNVAAAGLPLGAAGALANVVLTMRTARRTVRGELIAPFVRAAAVYLALAFVAGAALAVNLTTGWLRASWNTVFPMHIAAAAAGWFLMLVLGISYHLLTFFGLVAKKHRFRWPATVRGMLHLGIGCVVVGGVLKPVGKVNWSSYYIAFGLLLLAAACLLFVWDSRGLYALRGKERMHPPVVYVRAAHAYLAVCAAMLIAYAVTAAVGAQLSATWLVVLAFAAGAGWLSSTIVGYMHRIVPFVVWHNRYWGRGREPGVPPFRDMVNNRLAWVGFAMYQLGVAGTAVSFVSPLPAFVFLVVLAFGTSLATVNLLWTFVR